MALLLGTVTAVSCQAKNPTGQRPNMRKAKASVDRKNPFVNEQVTLTLKFLIAVQYYGSPELTEPTTTGFWTEVLGNKAPYLQKINDRTYKVIERKYALFPTQIGDLTIGSASIHATIADRGRRYRDPFDALGDFLTVFSIKS